MRTLIALLAGLLMTAAANAQNQGEIMKDTKQTQTLCLGRFLVDVPKGAYMVGQSAEYRWDKVDVTRRVSREAFQKFILDKEKVLKETRHAIEPSLLKHISRSGDGNSVVMVFWDGPKTTHVYETEAYKWIKGIQFLIKGDASQDKVPVAVDMANRSLSELQYRRNGEIPTTPGFCIEDGFFVGEPVAPHYEKTTFNMRLKEHPDVQIYIYTSTNGEMIEVPLLARVDRTPTPDFLKELAKQIKALRRGNHPVGSYAAEELLETYPRENGHPTHKFVWESGGKPRDIFAPVIVVNMATGESSEYDSVRPSLTDKQAIELFDSIVNSIRLRPTGTPAATNPGKQSKAPLGTSLISGETCPQSGEWECYHEQAEGDRRRYFAEGDVFPEVLLPVPRTYWQKLRGEPASGQFKTSWVLRRLPEDKS